MTPNAPTSLLDQLRPNHLPEPIGFWPPAIGWWLLAAAVMSITILLAMVVYRYIKKNRYRSMALSEARQLQDNFQGHQSPQRFAQNCNELLKRVALHAYPDRQVAGLHGEQWRQFLAETGKTPDFANSNAFSNDRFNPNAMLNTDNTYELTRRWIKKHHA
ncbi:DUF4381 domain-containing protein [uncultured Endozoicomonas sp.]|uniref:DUF4381 domain-containing protein n=1 Tax=uncultured Endozoicomonas sp. TaxID=432652 RepID=UPI0026019D5C|nr:DUF4381 domain-containing protein [uncultured Endozoicomonas sp.]